jgi:hypothetical protein
MGGGLSSQAGGPRNSKSVRKRNRQGARLKGSKALEKERRGPEQRAGVRGRYHIGGSRRKGVTGWE